MSSSQPDHFNRFTREAKQALVVAQEVAKKTSTTYVGTEHILIGILSQPNSLGAKVLQNFGVSIENVNLVLKTVGRTQTTGANGKTPGGLSGFAKKVIEDAVRFAHDFNHSFVGTEHLLFALVQQDNTAATVILENMKIGTKDIEQELLSTFEKMKAGSSNVAEKTEAHPNQGSNNPLEVFLNGLQGVLSNQPGVQEAKEGKSAHKKRKESKTPALDYFTTDLIKEAAEGKLDPVIGRHDEVERCIAILMRKTKNNPVLIGEPGVGKTAVIEGLAQRIHEEEVPEAISDKRILSLSMASVVAGTKYRGEFEERIRQIIDEAGQLGNVILFIDELHTVIGAGSAEGSLDAANILKPALSRGKIQVIGATTTNEYRKHVETDAALERRFQPVMIEEPNEEDAIAILKGLKTSFEEHHNLLIDEEALVAAVHLSKRYVNDRFLPDKAIDLVDEASALRGLRIKPDNKKIKHLQAELKEITKTKEQAVNSQDYEKAALLRQDELRVMEEIEAQKRIKIPRELRGVIHDEDIAAVISKMTGVPVQKLVKEDLERLKNLEKTLDAHVVGQDEAIKKVATAIRRSRTGISNGKRPIASFIFLGPTGVGKTELVKTLAREVYHDENALIKIDMSEFMERHNTSRLTGTTAGYVGYEDGGQLTERVRRKPYSVVLFDEIEKAHPEVFNLLLQILEDGVLTDGKGRKIDFKNTIIIMTSNIGAHLLNESAAPIGFSLSSEEQEQAMKNFESKKDEVLKAMKDKFRPEFLNRIDNIIVFKPLSHEAIKEIVKLHVAELQDRLSKKQIQLELSDKALEHLAKVSVDPEYGARPVRRKVQELLEDSIAEGLMNETFGEGSHLIVNFKPKSGLKEARIEIIKKRSLQRAKA